MDKKPSFLNATIKRKETHNLKNALSWRHKKQTLSDRFAKAACMGLRFIADQFFKKRYGHRAVVLETVAAVPGTVAGVHTHLRSIRDIKDDEGWVRHLWDEAENERMHLMTFVEIAKPSFFERMIILSAQAVFFSTFFVAYAINPRTMHRFVGYMEEEAVRSYTEYLNEIDAGRIDNVAAPQIAIEYWGLCRDAKLRDVVIAVRNDEAEHRDANHSFAEAFDKRKEEKRQARKKKTRLSSKVS